METKSLIKFNMWKNTYKVNNEVLERYLQRYSRIFGFKKYYLYKKAYFEYTRHPDLYDMDSGDELLLIKIFGIACKDANPRNKMEINKLLNEIENLPVIPWKDEWTGYPLSFEEKLKDTISRTSLYVVGDNIIPFGRLNQIRTIRVLFYMGYNIDDIRKSYENWIGMISNVLHALVPLSNHQQLENILIHDLQGEKVEGYTTK